MFYSGCFVRLWSDVSCFSSLALYPESSPFLFLFAGFRSGLSIGGCCSLHLFCVFSFRSAFLTCLLPLPLLSFDVLPFPAWGALWFPSLVRGFSLPSISSRVLFFFLFFFWSLHLVSLGFVPPLLVPAFSFGLFSVSLVRPHVMLVLTLSLSFAYSFLAPLSSFLFLSLSLRLVFLMISCGFFLRFLLRLFFGWVPSLFIFLSVVLTFRLTRFHSLSPFTSVPSVVVMFFRLCFFSACSGASDSLSLALAVSFRSRSLFACPRSPVRSFS